MLNCLKWFEGLNHFTKTASDWFIASWGFVSLLQTNKPAKLYCNIVFTGGGQTRIKGGYCHLLFFCVTTSSVYTKGREDGEHKALKHPKNYVINLITKYFNLWFISKSLHKLMSKRKDHFIFIFCHPCCKWGVISRWKLNFQWLKPLGGQSVQK